MIIKFNDFINESIDSDLFVVGYFGEDINEDTVVSLYSHSAVGIRITDMLAINWKKDYINGSTPDTKSFFEEGYVFTSVVADRIVDRHQNKRHYKYDNMKKMPVNEFFNLLNSL